MYFGEKIFLLPTTVWSKNPPHSGCLLLWSPFLGMSETEVQCSSCANRQVHRLQWPPGNIIGENCCFPGPGCPASQHSRGTQMVPGSCEPSPFLSRSIWGFITDTPRTLTTAAPHSSHSSPNPNPVTTSILVLLHGPFLSVPSHGSVSLPGYELQGGRDPLLYPDTYSPWGRRVTTTEQPNWTDSTLSTQAEIQHLQCWLILAMSLLEWLHCLHPYPTQPGTCYMSQLLLSFWEGGQNQTPQFLCF